MPNWKKYKLINACTKIGSGATPRGGDASYKTEGISLIRSQNVLDFTFSEDGLAFIDDVQANELANVEIKERDVLLNITGDSVARVCQVPDKVLPARVNQHVAILRTNKDLLNPEFLKYSLLSRPNKEMLLTLASTGATRKALTKSMLEQFEIDVPDEEGTTTQTRIASILSALDDKIELNRRTNYTLEQIAQTLFKKYFVTDIDPDNLPEGWRWGKLSDVTVRITKGTTPTTLKKQFVSSGINFFKVENLNDNGAYDLSKMNFIDEETDGLLSRSRIQENDILFSIAGTLGRVAYVNKDILPANTNQALAIIRPDANLTKPLFIYYWLKLPNVREDIFSNSVRGVQANLSLGVLSNIDIIIPSKNVLENVFNLIDPLFNRIQKNENENLSLSKIRDSLLPKLMNDEIEVN